MSSASNKRRLCKQAALKAMVHDASEKIGSSVLSLALVLSLIPAPAIAYAIGEEGVPEEQGSELGAPADMSGGEQGTDATGGGSGSNGSDNGGAGESGTGEEGNKENTGATVTTGGEQGTDSQGGDQDKQAEGDETPAEPKVEKTAPNPDDIVFNAAVSVNAGDNIVKDKMVYSQNDITAGLTVAVDTNKLPEGIKSVTVTEVTAGEGITVTPTGDTWTLTTKNEAGTYGFDNASIKFTYVYDEVTTTTTVDPENKEEKKEVSTEEKTGEGMRDLACTGEVLSVVVDKARPVITPWVDDATGDTTPASIADGVQTRYLDLSSGQVVAPKMVVEDENFDEGSVTLKWVDADGNEVASNGATTVKFDENKTATLPELSAKNFVDKNGALLYAVVTFEGKDLAKNPVEAKIGDNQVTAIKFTSESAWVENAKATLVVPKGVKSATRSDDEGNARTVYNNGVSVKTSVSKKYADNVTVKLTDNNVELTDPEEGVYAIDAVNGTHQAVATFATPHGASKTVAVDVFDIDTTIPEINVELINNTGALEDGALFYGNGSAPVLVVTVVDGTGSTLDESDPYDIQLFTHDDEGNEKQIEDKFSCELTEEGYVLSVPKESTEYFVKVTPKTIFGDTVVDNVKQTGVFVVDTIAPKIMLDFTGPMAQSDALNKIAAFFKASKETKDYEEGTVGSLTITVTDDSLKTIAVEGVKGIEGEQAPTSDGMYQIEVPYIQTEDGQLVFIGEGDGLTITVKASDEAGNTSEYSYNKPDAGEGFETNLPGEAEGETFIIDTTPVDIKGFAVDTPVAYTEDGTGIDVYDAESVNVTATVADAHFDAKHSRIFLSKNGGQEEELETSWTQNDDGTWSAGITLSEDKDTQSKGTRVLYNVKLVANDLLGNATQSATTEEQLGLIALDTQSPTLEVKYSLPVAGNANETDYYQGDTLTAEVKATDPFFNPDKAASKLASLGKYGTWDGVWTETEEGSGIWTTKATFAENDKIGVTSTLSIAVADHIKHPASRAYVDDSPNGNGKFIVDNTPPEVTNVKFDRAAVGAYEGTDYFVANTKGEDTLVATITVKDLNFNADSSISQVVLKEGSNGEWDGNWVETKKNSGTYTTKVTYHQTAVDQTADFTINAVDFATNKATENTTYQSWSTDKESKAFVVDVDKPEIKVVFDKAPVGSVNNVDYYDEKPTATITVTDNNFDAKSSPITPSGGKVIQDWEKSGALWTAKVEFGENREGDFVEVDRSKLDIVSVDKAYMASEKTIKDHDDSWAYADLETGNAPEFVVDLTCPAVTVSIDKAIQTTFNQKDFYADDVTMTLEIVDNNFDPSSPVAARHASHGFTKWENPSGDRKTYTASVRFGENENINDPSDLRIDARDMVWAANNAKEAHLNVYEYRVANTGDNSAKKIKTNRSGNGAEIAAEFIVDKTAPRIDRVDNGNNPSAVGNGIQFFNQLTSLKYYFADNNGLDTVELNDPDGQYMIAKGQHSFARGDMRNNSPVTMQLVEKVSIDRDAYDGTHDGKAPVELMVTDITGNYRVWTIDSQGRFLNVRTGSFTTDINISIDGKGVYPTALVQDTTAPVVSLSPKSLEGTFSNQTQSVTTTIDEFNFSYLQRFEGNRTVVRITKQEGNAGRATSVVEIPALAFAGGGASWSHTQMFDTDGHYVVEAQFKDYAENQSNLDRIGEFTIDKTPPVIESITYDNNDVRNGRYYKAGRTATITIIEHNWDPSLVTVNTNGVFNGWSDSGDTHVGTVSFLTDGDYNLSVSLTDKAGNAADKTEPEFTVDLTNPTLEFYLKNEKQDPQKPTAFADAPLEARIEFMDEKNFEAGEYTVTSNKESVLAPQRALQYPAPGNSGNGATVNFAYPAELEYDDIYTLKAKATDLAGNEVEKEYRFSLNRFGSNFEIVDESDYKDASGKTKYLKEPQTVQVREVNVTGADRKDQDVSITHGLDTNKLQHQERNNPSGEGFYVDASQDQYQWAEYLYNVYEPNFYKKDSTSNEDNGKKTKANGLYSVVVSSTDSVENQNTSDEFVDHDVNAKPEPGQTVPVNDATVEFILDMEKPIIDNVNFEDGKLYNHGKAENANLTFSVTDNFEVADVKVKMDDGAETSVKPIEGSDSEYSVPMEAKSFKERSFSIVATDKAGNEREVARNGLKNTSNFFELYWPFLAGIAAVGAGGWFIFGRRRRDDEEEQAY